VNYTKNIPLSLAWTSVKVGERKINWNQGKSCMR